MAKLNIHDIDVLRNVNESRVWDIFSEYVEHSGDTDICTCSICVLDVVAITLNSIPSHYQTIGASLDEARDKVPDKLIIRAVASAVTKVKENPHH